MIISVAVRGNDGKIFIGDVGTERHSHVISRMIRNGQKALLKGSVMGFINQAGLFLNRSEAAAEAYKIGQISEEVQELFSEMVWIDEKAPHLFIGKVTVQVFNKK